MMYNTTSFLSQATILLNMHPLPEMFTFFTSGCTYCWILYFHQFGYETLQKDILASMYREGKCFYLFYYVKSAQVHAKIGAKTLGSPSDVTVMSESMDNQDSGIYVAFIGTESVKIKEKL